MSSTKISKESAGKQYYVSTTGKRTNEGTLESPWSLAHAIRGAGEQIQPGDTVYVCGGTYPAGLNITVSGTASQKITYKPCPGENVILDGSLPEFTAAGNTAWVPYQVKTGHNIYRSAKCYPLKESYGGFIELEGEWYSLAPHKLHTFLMKDLQLWDKEKPRYLGPGIAQDLTGKGCPPGMGYLYIRLDDCDPEAQLHRPVPQVGDPDPRHHSLHIGDTSSYGIKISGSHLVIEGFTQINTYGVCLLINKPGVTDITIRDCGGSPLYFGMRCGAVDNLLLDSCKFYAHMPGDKWWVSYADIKVAKKKADGTIPPGEPPADHVRKAGLDLGAAVHVKAVHCLFEQFFDGILGQTPHDVEVHHSIFKSTWDDAWQMNGGHVRIDFHHNYCFGAGPSVDGARTGELNDDPGTLYIHHNIIDTTKDFVYWGRCKAPLEGMFEAIPLSSHAGDQDRVKFMVPRKIYYNTIVTGRKFNEEHLYVGWSYFGSKGRDLTSPAQHEVYNNIFLVGDGRPGGRDFDAVSQQEIYDGNVYWRYWDGSPSAVKSPWHQLWVSSQKLPIKGLMTVEELHRMAYPDSHLYYPPGWEKSGLSDDPQLDFDSYMPKARSCRRGAVNLKNKGWPGTSDNQRWRGAIEPFPFPQKSGNRARKAK
jgi:hypothetical protein